MRVNALQIWPLLDRLADRTLVATVAGSASSRTIAADLPPTSRLTRRRSVAHAAATALPALVDPVNETLSTPGCFTSISPTEASPGSTLTTPSGSPDSAIISASSKAFNGDSGAGLRTIVQPASSAGISLVTIRNCGMFHGTMAATTPTGSRRIAMSEPYSPGLASRHGYASARSQNAFIIVHGSATCARWAKLIGAPISEVISSAISARRSP